MDKRKSQTSSVFITMSIYFLQIVWICSASVSQSTKNSGYTKTGLEHRHSVEGRRGHWIVAESIGRQGGRRSISCSSDRTHPAARRIKINTCSSNFQVWVGALKGVLILPCIRVILRPIVWYVSPDSRFHVARAGSEEGAHRRWCHGNDCETGQ